MPRSIVIGNGSMLATFDASAQMRDFYYPYVGMEDHTAYGDIHYLGVMVEGQGFSWINDGTWSIRPAYKSETLVGDTTIQSSRFGLAIVAEDFVHPVYNILVRHLLVHSTDGTEKNVRFFFNHDFHIYGDKQKDTAFYEPYTNTVIHYRHKRYFLIGGETSDPLECHNSGNISETQSILHSRQFVKSCGISSYSIGKSEYHGLEGTWRDAEDGELARTTIDQGSVDSTVAIHCRVRPNADTHVTMWVCLGQTLDEVMNLQQLTLQETPERLQRNCHYYWKSWVNKVDQDFGTLGKDVEALYKRSLLITRIHADNNGGIIAAADADIMQFNKDTYTYVWPRDGAFVSIAMDKAGYMEITRRFFDFCCRAQSPDGYMLHKYNPDASYGSSWHPWFRNGEAQLPIQEDETALILVALWNHFEYFHDFEFLQSMYERFVKRAAQFLCDYRELETGLPIASYDPWEEHRAISTYTTSCTVAGLKAAAQLCAVLGHYTHSEHYRTVAEEMQQAMLFHLFDESTGRFVKFIRRRNSKTVERDLTLDMSITHIWRFHILPCEDPRIVSTMDQLIQALTVRTSIGGIARYTNDFYHSKVPPTADIPGNPWIITTLWIADWHIRKAKTVQDLQPAREILEWVTRQASSTGVLPEQLHPLTGEHLSVAPLTWSHATFIDTILTFVQKEKSLQHPS